MKIKISLNFLPGTGLAALMLLLTACLPISALGEEQKDQTISISKGMPVYVPPVKKADIRRREGGIVESDGSGTRGLVRGLVRGPNRGLVRGLVRGPNRGLVRGLVRGPNRGLVRGLVRGPNRGLVRGLVRGPNRGLVRGLVRGPNRGLVRGLVRGPNRGLVRGLVRGPNRGLVRGPNRGLVRGPNRGLVRGLVRGENRGLVRGENRGLVRGENRGLVRGENRGLVRGAEYVQEMVPIPSRMSPLASEHTGLTTQDQPSLRFYISDPWPDDIEFALNEPEGKEPVLETFIKGPFKKGIYRINLAEYNIRLKPDIEYEWLIAVVPDPEERSADFLGSATIKYVKAPDDLTVLLANTKKHELHFVYAEK